MKYLLILILLSGFSVGTVLYSNQKTEAQLQANWKQMMQAPPTPTDAPSVVQTKTAVSKVKCQIFNDVFYYNTQAQCQYWQQYWYGKQAQIGQGQVTQTTSEGLNLMPVELKHQEFKPLDRQPLPTLAPFATLAPGPTNIPGIECKWEHNSQGRLEYICK